MDTATPIFTFATLRNPTGEPPRDPAVEIQLTTSLVKSVMETIESKDEQAKKITTINQKLEAFIQSKDFFRTKAELDEAMKIAPPVEPGATARRPQGPADTNPERKLTKRSMTTSSLELLPKALPRTLSKHS